MASSLRNFLRVGVCALALSAAATTVAQATEGYFVEGASARDQALAGAGMADPTEAVTNANNPAGLVDVGHQLNMDATAFMPWRGYSATPGASPFPNPIPGNYSSYRTIFAIPALAYSLPTSPDSAWGVSMVGNGGMDTSFPSSIGGGCGVFYGGFNGAGCTGGAKARTGVDLNQALFSVGYARRFGNLSVGLAPVLSIQVFSAYGLSAFSGSSMYGNFVSDHSPSYSVGAGLRAGAIYRVNQQFSLAVAGSTPMWSGRFTNYHGLFAQSGSFDIPATIGAGVAYRIMPTITAMLDYKHIFYSDVPSIANPLSNLTVNNHLLGSPNGPGFGWRDVDVIALGVEWKYSDALTLRAGYAYSTQPITAANVVFNILAPGVVTSHIGAGFSYHLNYNSSVEFSALYSPRIDVSGPDPFNPGANVNIHLEELALTLGYNYRFGAPPAPVVAKY